MHMPKFMLSRSVNEQHLSLKHTKIKDSRHLVLSVNLALKIRYLVIEELGNISTATRDELDSGHACALFCHKWISVFLEYPPERADAKLQSSSRVIGYFDK